MTLDNSYDLHAPPIFVCGVQRSGTTLLVKMLSQHPDVEFLPQETHFYPLFWNRKDDLSRFGSPAEFADILSERLPAVNFGWTGTKSFLEALTNAIRDLDAPPGTTASLLKFTMHLWQRDLDGNIRTGEKTPAHIYYAPRILKEFPECKFIVMCRDPRAAALSERVKLEGNQRVDRKFSAYNFIVRWSTATMLSRKLEKSGKALLVKYEDLITSPGSTLGQVAAFLGMDTTDEMLEVGVTNSSFSDMMQQGIGFNTDNLNRWEMELDPATISLIDHHLGSEMESLGYAPSGIKADLGKFPLVRQKAKLIAARKVCNLTPAHFHHYNRNKKYRF